MKISLAIGDMVLAIALGVGLYNINYAFPELLGKQKKKHDDNEDNEENP